MLRYLPHSEPHRNIFDCIQLFHLVCFQMPKKTNTFKMTSCFFSKTVWGTKKAERFSGRGLIPWSPVTHWSRINSWKCYKMRKLSFNRKFSRVFTLRTRKQRLHPNCHCNVWDPTRWRVISQSQRAAHSCRGLWSKSLLQQQTFVLKHSVVLQEKRKRYVKWNLLVIQFKIGDNNPSLASRQVGGVNPH